MTPKWYEPLSSFSSLDGWRSPRIAVGDLPDARICRFLFVATVIHGWPSQDKIIFSNREVFRIASRTINGKKVFLFDCSNEIERRLRRQRAEEVILSDAEKAPLDEREAIVDLVVRTANPQAKSTLLSARFAPIKTIQQHLPDLSLSEVEQIASLLRWPAAA